MNPLERFEVTTFDNVPELMCKDCSAFYKNIIYMSLPEIIAIAEKHIKDKHVDVQ